jgi:hypothetical protein
MKGVAGYSQTVPESDFFIYFFRLSTIEQSSVLVGQIITGKTLHDVAEN